MPPGRTFCLALAGTATACIIFFVALSRSEPLSYAPIGDSPLDAIDRATTNPANIEALKSGLDALASNRVEQARSIRDSLPAGMLDRHILQWAIALRGGPSVPSSEIAAAARVLAGWPGASVFRRNSERAMAREKPMPEAVVQLFGATRPETVEGTLLLARALVALDKADQARTLLAPFWRMEKLDAEIEGVILAEFGTLISAADHRFRMEAMLYLGRYGSAKRVAELAGAMALADAWVAVAKGAKNANKLLDAVPAAQRGPGYLFALARYQRRTGNISGAAKTMLKAPVEATELIDPDAWWIERRVLSRELLDVDDIQTAYTVAAAHSAESPANAVDAEFHAGWYALRGLKNPQVAAKHFLQMTEIAEGPISLSRAFYWLGRSAEAGGPGKAVDFYAQGADFGTSFYGQLAAAKIGRAALSIDEPLPSEADRKSFETREAVRAISRLEAAGYPQRAESLYRSLAAELASPGELALLAAMAEGRGNHYLALRVGKIAASRGMNIGALSHPVGAIPETAMIDGSGKALAYAIARQESEFNTGAVSHAGARGLLQLMPATAKAVAKQTGMPYSRERLTSDAGYNATLGAAFLGEQLGRFEGSYVLTFAGYNAGPGRAREWMKRYGDPRGKDIDAVVDWIERIPYTETRSYVQRVMENYQVYKMRLSGHYDIVADLVAGR
ncbi:transglycosylase SLT domain-containing protein [Mesorhizobium sp. NBSH29]|uniref:lytic transglycosylase domain-containing protein n=1 Tax=Mesorhizobium sp. NBSH29 TaxID=2654249 RepID=UPI0018969E4F|nr:transglycosylase SLT domain-containing protein [Mesorhizobium sp. NBSH29]